MKTEEIKSLKIELDGIEADHLKSALKKIGAEVERAGFKKIADLSSDEIKIIKDLNQKVNP